MIFKVDWLTVHIESHRVRTWTGGQRTRITGMDQGLRKIKWGATIYTPLKTGLLRRVSSIWPIGLPFLLPRSMRSRRRFQTLFAKGLSELDIFSDSRTALQAFYFLVCASLKRLETWSKVGESSSCIKATLNTPTMSVKMHWQGRSNSSHVRYAYSALLP